MEGTAKAEKKRTLYPACQEMGSMMELQKSIMASAKDAVKVLRKGISQCEKNEKNKVRERDRAMREYKKE